MEKLIMINFTVAAIFFVCYCYQFLYVATALVQKDKPHKEEKAHHFAVLIAARNEAEVIGHLIESIQAQTYQKGNVTVFVVADNCTDNTAQIARNLGAVVYERFNQDKIGK
ncbi:glycosyltransferase, partial [Turicibacter sanguinis]|nr:glycosyltransferase [Turicibacter sanguinis]